MKFETLFEMQILEAKFIRDICKYLSFILKTYRIFGLGCCYEEIPFFRIKVFWELLESVDAAIFYLESYHFHT